MKILDLFCGVGGASMGYYLGSNKTAEIVGVDNIEQPNYPFTFIQADVLSLDIEFLSKFDLIHASPPCQEFSVASITNKKKGKKYQNLIEQVRSMLIESKKNYVIENVQQAPIKKDLILFGYMFGLKVIRKRVFEISKFVLQPQTPTKIGKVNTGDFVTVAGNGYNKKEILFKGKLKNFQHLTLLENRKLAMQLHWAKTMKEVTNAIPPKYTEYIYKIIFNLNPPKK